VAPVYIDGEKGPTLKGDRIAEEFQQLVEQYVERTYAPGADASPRRPSHDDALA
jgi:(E)-4-hydroxy-3-methylbut-2-enyl-diphosphate synthase